MNHPRLPAWPLIRGTFCLVLAACAAPEPPKPAAQAFEQRLHGLLTELADKARPGNAHLALQDLVGQWDLEVQARTGPDSAWERSTGRSTCVLALGGRYVVEHWSATLQGQPFEAMQVLGYDKLAERFVSIWMDSFSTWPVTSSGRMGSDGRTLELAGTMRDVLAPDGRPFELRLEFLGSNERSLELLDRVGGQPFCVLRLRARRR